MGQARIYRAPSHIYREVELVLDVSLYNRRLAEVAGKLTTGNGEVLDNHALLLKIVKERGEAFRRNHSRRTTALIDLMQEDHELAAELAVELITRNGNGA